MPEPAHVLAQAIVQGMLDRDAFSAWLGVQVIEVKPQRVAIRMTVRNDMLNGFGVCHGGVTFAFADSALAFASNTHGKLTVSIENSIRYPAPAHSGDQLTAIAEPEHVGNRIGYYRATITNQSGAVVGLFRGTVYSTSKSHDLDGGKTA